MPKDQKRVVVHVLDGDHILAREVKIQAGDKRHTTRIDGALYEHVDTTNDGIWRYAPMK